MRNEATTPAAPSAVRRVMRHHVWWRGGLMRLGLQGKLIICFTALLFVQMSLSGSMFLSQSNRQQANLMGEQARQMSYALALAGRPALMAGNYEELRRIGLDLLSSRNILFVAFLDADGKPLAMSSRDPGFDWSELTTIERSIQSLMQVRQEHSPRLGDYLEVFAPVVSSTPQGTGSHDKTKTHLIGYVAVGISQVREQAQLHRINYAVFGIGCMIGILSLPLAYILVYRIFMPIRELVAASNRLAEGDLDAQVAVHRPDVIGTLARAFNKMVQRVKLHQQALADANRGLEAKVHQRTAQLETANKRLSAEIAEKEDFLRAVSHDLNAPLRNIAGMTTMLMMKHKDSLDADAIHRLERIQKNVEVETDLISELLELSRIKTQRQTMESIEIDALVRELGDIFENDLKSRQIELHIDNPLPVLHCERARIRQVFQNLIDNAIKYMGQGSCNEHGVPERRIHIGCVARSSEAEFYVRDTGMGIDADDVGKVFNVFRRGRNGAAQSIPGKGVGLASVKSIIETYNGSIWVESQVGRGSTFRFTINGQYVPSLCAGISPTVTKRSLLSRSQSS